MKLPRYSLLSLFIFVTCCSLYAGIAKAYPKLAIALLWNFGIFLTFVIADRASNLTLRLSLFFVLVLFLILLTFWIGDWFPRA